MGQTLATAWSIARSLRGRKEGGGKRNEGAERRVAQHSPITTMWRQTLPAELSVYSANELLHALFGSKREVLLLLIL